MRVVRILLGVVLVAVAVLAVLGGGALWIAMQHASSDGGFGGPVIGLATNGNAIVVPDIDALLRAHASLTGHSGTSVSIDATTATGPAFIGLAPISSIQAYLGSAPYGRVTSLRTGSGGIPVTISPAAGLPSERPAGAGAGAGETAAGSAAKVALPGAQRFWVLTGAGGRIGWAPSDRRYDRLALVIMRSDAGGPVAVTARAEVRAGWLAATTWALFSVGTVIAVLAIAMLMWPSRRREIVYVVTPTQLPEIAHRLGVPIPIAGPNPGSEPHRVPEPRPQEVYPQDGYRHGDPPAWAGATGQQPVVSGPPSIPAIFADPDRRPNTLRAAMLLDQMPVNQTYRSFGTPPPVTPAFLWTPASTAGATPGSAEVSPERA